MRSLCETSKRGLDDESDEEMMGSDEQSESLVVGCPSDSLSLNVVKVIS